MLLSHNELFKLAVRHKSSLSSLSADETGRSRDASGSVWWTSMRPSRESSAPVVAVSGGGSSSSGSGGGDMFVAILLGCAGAFMVIVGVIGVIVVLRWRSKRSTAERSPRKTSSMSNTRCTNFSLNYLSPSPAPVNYAATAKVCLLATCWRCIPANEHFALDTDMREFNSRNQFNLVHKIKSKNAVWSMKFIVRDRESTLTAKELACTETKTYFTKCRNLFQSFPPQLMFSCYLLTCLPRRTKLHRHRVPCYL